MVLFVFHVCICLLKFVMNFHGRLPFLAVILKVWSGFVHSSDLCVSLVS